MEWKNYVLKEPKGAMSILRYEIINRDHQRGLLGNNILKGDQGSDIAKKEKGPVDKGKSKEKLVVFEVLFQFSNIE